MADKEVIILGMAPSRLDCTWDVPIYACNNSYRQISVLNGRLDKVFLAHDQVVDKEGDQIFDWEEMNRLVELGVEIFNTHKVEGLNSKLYPLGFIVQKLGRNYFSDTICYMITYLLHEWTTVVNDKLVLISPEQTHRIKLYGVDMKTEDEYNMEKGGVEYWIGRAEGLGIEVWVHPDSELFKTSTGYPYGTNMAEVAEKLVQEELVKLVQK